MTGLRVAKVGEGMGQKRKRSDFSGRFGHYGRGELSQCKRVSYHRQSLYETGL